MSDGWTHMSDGWTHMSDGWTHMSDGWTHMSDGTFPQVKAHVFLSSVLTLASEECTYAGLRIRVLVTVRCEDGYFCCENNTQCWLVEFIHIR